MFNEVIRLASENTAKKDKTQLTILHNSLKSPIFCHTRDIDNLTGEQVLERFTTVLNSYKGIKADDSFEVRSGVMRLRKGTGKSYIGNGRIPLFPHLNETKDSSILNKKSIVSSVCNNDYLCAAKSLVICKVKLDGDYRDYKNLLKAKKPIDKRVMLKKT